MPDQLVAVERDQTQLRDVRVRSAKGIDEVSLHGAGAEGELENPPSTVVVGDGSSGLIAGNYSRDFAAVYPATPMARAIKATVARSWRP